MVEPIAINVKHLAQDVRIPQEQVQAAIELLDAGLPVPFIAQYRKEVTLNLNEDALRQIDEELRFARLLGERKLTILKTIQASGKLTPELDKSIRDAKSIKRLEDIYSPFKPKRQSPATTARDNGLEPFALDIIEGKVLPENLDEEAAKYINTDKNVQSIADVLLGTGHIIADIFGSKIELIQKVRDIFYQHGQLVTAKVDSPLASRSVPVVEDAENEGSREEPVAEDAENEESREEPVAEDAENEEPREEPVVEDAENEEPREEPVAEDAENEELREEPVAEDAENEESREEPVAEDAENEKSCDSADEVTELFEQLKEEQAEKGLPVVRSQNALRKKKKAEAKKKLDEIKQRQREHFERQFSEFFNFSTKLRGVPAHRILAFNRGERHKIIKITFKIDEARLLESVKDICVPAGHIHADFLKGCLQDSLKRLIIPALSREVRNEMTDYAEKNAVKTFGENLRNLLLQPTLPKRRILALDPGGKHGCVAVALDEYGNLAGHETVFLTGNAQRRASTAETLAEMIRRFGLTVIAIGIGGGSRVAEELIGQMLETHFANDNLSYTLVNRVGSVAYSTSQAAKEELPYADPFVRAAVSLGRRLQDSLVELSKIDPASLGQGIMQQEMRGKHLKQMLEDVIGACVNFVGVDLNSATAAMLTHVSGLNLMTARRIYEYRRERGGFRTREELKNVPGVNETVYLYAAGFLRISGGENPLDATHIHPESYELAGNILEKLGFSVHDLRNSEKAKAITEKIAAEGIGELTVRFSAELQAGINTVRDILEEFVKPGRDPRDSQPPIVFRRKPLVLEDLTPGKELTGTVLNVTDFGAFVDVGLQESGFIHISQMSSGYIQNAHERLAVGNTVRVWVVESDGDKKRVALTLLPPGTAKQGPPFRRPADGNRERPPREHTPRPPRPEGDRPPRDSRDGKRYEKSSGGRSFDRAPRTFVSAPVKKEEKPITEKMKQGKEPMRSFSDLAQLFGNASSDDAGEGSAK
ncbi:MAG: helix-hairpin-helix domain-containing protein [Planctomycetaceae bacterium]|nr:helix-hairpin-helix domain-containing protein [Planctomycetaceae bacterium]